MYPRSTLPFAKLGEYELLRLIATGGMSEVYRAYDPQLDRERLVLCPGVVNSHKEGAEGQRDARQKTASPHLPPPVDPGCQ